MRGAFDLVAQLNCHPQTVALRHYAPVHSQRLESTKDLEVNRLIKAALRVVAQLRTLTAEVREVATRFLDHEFDGVSDSTYGVELSELEPPDHYVEALELAELVLQQWSQGRPGAEMRGFELLQPGWVMWEKGVRAKLDVELFGARARGDRSLRLTEKGSLVFGDRSAGDGGAMLLRRGNSGAAATTRGRIYPDMLLELHKRVPGNPGVLCGDCKYFETSAHDQSRPCPPKQHAQA